MNPKYIFSSIIYLIILVCSLFAQEKNTSQMIEIETKDVDGGKIPLHFYTDGRGSELAPAQLRSGYTVAILYAKRHVFTFGPPGIRHEDPRMIKVRLPL